MSVLFDRLASALPERHAPRRNSFASDARSVRHWLAQLPLANPGATARLLMSALRELNQLHIDPQQRIDALELLREPIGEIVATLDKQVLGDSFPLPPLKQQIGQLAQDFEHELALGYCAAVYDLCAPAGAVPFLRGKAVALALTRAMRHRGGFLYQAYLRYHAPPAGAWQNLHDLFGFAAAVGAVDRAVPGRAGTTTSVRLAYIQVLLFALSNPYRFSQRENGDIHELTRIWSTHCDLREGRAPTGAIAIRTGEDHGPGYIAAERHTPEAGSWALEISGLVRFLEGHLALLPPGTLVTQFGSREAPVTVATELVVRLMHAWESGAERSQPRLPAGHSLESVVGLHDLHFALAGNADFEAFLIKTRGVAITLHESDRAAAWTNPASGGNARIRCMPARVVDQSLGGYRLVWEKTEGMRLRVGELLGLAPLCDDDETRDWMVGAIRWLRIEGEGMQAGVALLARRAQPAAVRSFDAHGVPRAAMRAIALEDMGSGEMAAIVVPALFERDAGEIELTRPGDPYSWPAEPIIETLRGLRTSDGGGGYLRIELLDGAGAIESGAPQAANDDSGIAASVHGDGA